ncbi:MAG: PAS domain S-box protein [Granulosicoccus sp.]|nr:PAS domain S-box protein [Granulosicoccus sp.]
MISEDADTPLDEIFDTVGVAILTIDELGLITSANFAATQLFGYRHDDLLGANVSMLMPEPDQSRHDSYLANYCTTGDRKIIGIGRQVTGLRSDHKTFPMHLSVAEHRRGGQRGFTGIVQDLSALNQAQTDTARFGRILDSAVNEIYVFDSTTLRFTMVNQGALNNLGYSFSEMKTMTPSDIKPYDEKSFAELIEPLKSGELKSLHFDSKHVRKDSSQYDVEISLHLSDAVKPAEFVAVVQDVTEKNRIMDALHRSQKMESVGNLTGGISHDFNNLLTVISGNLELLESKLDNPLQRELLAEAQEAAAMGARLTKRLLAFSRRSKLSPREVDVNALVLGLTDMLRRTLGDNIKLDNKLNPQLWGTTVDISELENAIVNLSLNARDAMPNGGKLTIETDNYTLSGPRIAAEELPLGDYIKISVIDTGSGISTEMQQKIFEPFVTTKSETHGTGLGLSMVFGFCRQSGGDVRLQSSLGVGSNFSIYLPRSQSEAAQSSVTTSSGPMEVSGGTILVVEDEERVRRLTVRRLVALGFNVLEAADGYDALEQFNQRDDIDLVFTDVVMTEGMNGYDLAHAVLSRKPAARVLLTSGYAENMDNSSKLLESGLNLLQKPYTQDELVEALETEFKSG